MCSKKATKLFDRACQEKNKMWNWVIVVAWIPAGILQVSFFSRRNLTFDFIHLIVLYVAVSRMCECRGVDQVWQVHERWGTSNLQIETFIVYCWSNPRWYTNGWLARFFKWGFCLSSSQSHRGQSECLPGHVRGLPRVQQHNGNGGWHRSSGGALHPHPALRHVQIPEQGRGLVSRGREPQLHQQFSAVQRHRRQGEASQHCQNFEQEQEEQGQGVLRVIIRDVDQGDESHNINMCTASRWTLFSPFPTKHCSEK